MFGLQLSVFNTFLVSTLRTQVLTWLVFPLALRLRLELWFVKLLSCRRGPGHTGAFRGARVVLGEQEPTAELIPKMCVAVRKTYCLSCAHDFIRLLGAGGYACL